MSQPCWNASGGTATTATVPATTRAEVLLTGFGNESKPRKASKRIVKAKGREERLSDRPQAVVSLAHPPAAGPLPLPRLRRGRLSARVVARACAVRRTGRLPLRPGAGRDRG